MQERPVQVVLAQCGSQSGSALLLPPAGPPPPSLSPPEAICLLQPWSALAVFFSQSLQMLSRNLPHGAPTHCRLPLIPLPLPAHLPPEMCVYLATRLPAESEKGGREHRGKQGG